MTNDRDPEVAPTNDELQRRGGCLPLIFWISVGFVIYLGAFVIVLDAAYRLPIEALRSALDAFMRLDFVAGAIMMGLSAVLTVLIARRFRAVPTWLMVALPVATVVVFVGIILFGDRPVSVDNPVGTLQFDELSTALATDPDREVERIVGYVWRIEGPKHTIRGHGRYWFFGVDLGTNDGTKNRLYLEFVRDEDESRFETEEVPIACLITRAWVYPRASDAPDRPTERSIAAESCRVVDPDTNLATDPP